MSLFKHYITGLLLVTTFFLSINVSAQKSIEGVGYFIDQDGKELNGYYDLDYSPSGKISKNLNYQTEFGPGSYTDLEGRVHEGWVKWQYLSSFLFKETEASKPKKIVSTSCLTLKMGSDSLISKMRFLKEDVEFKAPPLRGYKPKNPQAYRANQKIPREGFFAIVMSEEGIDLIKPSHIESPSTWTTSKQSYFIKVDGAWQMIPKQTGKFKSFMSEFVADYKFMHNQILNDKLTYSSLEDILTHYKYYKKYIKKKPVFFTSDWVETMDKKKAYFILSFTDLVEDRWSVEYRAIGGAKILQGHYSSLSPEKREGKFTWYYPNGVVRKTAEFEKNKLSSLFQEFFENGKLHWVYKLNKAGNQRIYKGVFDTLGNSLLVSGLGEEQFEDVHLNRTINRRYREGRLVDSFYLGSNSQKIFQLKDGNNASASQYLVSRNIEYYPKTTEEIKQGLILASVIITPLGTVESIKILKSIDTKTDQMIIEALSKVEGRKAWSLERSKLKRIKQEVIVPVSFVIDVFYKKERYYYNNSFMDHHHQMMMQQQIINDIKVPSFPR